MSAPYAIELLVRDSELDQYGVVNNAVYLTYLEHARHEFLHQVGIDPAAVARTGKSLALSEIQVRFLSPLRSRERFRVSVSIADIGGARVVFSQGIATAGEERAVLEARAVAVFLNDQGRPMRVSREHREAFARFLIPG